VSIRRSAAENGKINDVANDFHAMFYFLAFLSLGLVALVITPLVIIAWTGDRLAQVLFNDVNERDR